MDGVWTLGELSERVAGALAGGYPAQASGRVRDVPDARTIRWYTTTGLVDRPAGMRGRTALYGRRHMLQLLAIKRLQAAGQTLAEIQQRLIGASEGELAELAELAGEPATAEQPGPRVPGADGAVPPLPVVRKRFWEGSAVPPPPPQPGRVHGVRLADGVTLLLPAEPADTDLGAIAEAAAPLLAVLRDRQLVSSLRKDPS